MKKFAVLFSVYVFAPVLWASVVIPAATAISVTSKSGGRIEVSYSLSAPAVVTFDVTTNGVSVGEDKFRCCSGDVFKSLSAGSRSFVWNALETMPNWHADAKAVLTAWPLNDKPPYMVVDISSDFADAASERIRYYASSNGIPGGIVANDMYKTNAIVFKRIYARGRQFSVGSGKTQIGITLTNDYYLAVFETTQAQWREVKGSTPAPFFQKDGAFRPMDNASFCRIREWSADTQKPEYQYPNPPYSGSFLGILRSRCGDLLDFDLPSRMQWVYAAACGYPYFYWGDGTPVTTSGNQGATVSKCPQLDGLSRYAQNGGFVPTSAAERTAVTTNGLDNGTAIVGSYRPNAFGIYDMEGNVMESTLDRYVGVTTYAAYPHGDVYTVGQGAHATMGGDCHCSVGSCFPQTECQDIGATVTSYSYSRGTYVGFRIMCRNGLK